MPEFGKSILTGFHRIIIQHRSGTPDTKCINIYHTYLSSAPASDHNLLDIAEGTYLGSNITLKKL